jgi:hypothetical protein
LSDGRGADVATYQRRDQLRSRQLTRHQDGDPGIEREVRGLQRCEHFVRLCIGERGERLRQIRRFVASPQQGRDCVFERRARALEVACHGFSFGLLGAQYDRAHARLFFDGGRAERWPAALRRYWLRACG